MSFSVFPVPILDSVPLEDVLSKINERKPVIIRNWDIGPCVSDWSFEYVSNKAGNTPVKIHVSQNCKLDFINKNFLYKTLPFSELIKRISRSSQKEYFIDSKEVYYLRSLGVDPRGKDAANFKTQFPELANDLKIPPFFESKDFFSSVFRASSQGLQLWTHYDVMDNMLVQIKGIKRVILWPPSEIDNMYLSGDKSQVLEVDNPDCSKYPKFINAVRYECLLVPGDIVFIPALWFHNIIAVEASIGVNIFWKNLPHEQYDKSDSYGNKDLIPAKKGLHAVETAIKYVEVFPAEYKNFYIRRMIKLLSDHLSED